MDLHRAKRGVSGEPENDEDETEREENERDENETQVIILSSQESDADATSALAAPSSAAAPPSSAAAAPSSAAAPPTSALPASSPTFDPWRLGPRRALQRNVSAPPTFGPWVGCALTPGTAVAAGAAPSTPQAAKELIAPETPGSSRRVGQVVPHQQEILPEMAPLADMSWPDDTNWPTPPRNDDDAETLAIIRGQPPVDHEQHKAERLLKNKAGAKKKVTKKFKMLKKPAAFKKPAAPPATDNTEEPSAPSLKRPAAPLAEDQEPEEKYLRATVKHEHLRDFVQVQLSGGKSKLVSMGCISGFGTAVALQLAKKAMSMVDPNLPDVKQKFKEALADVKRKHLTEQSQ